MALDLLMAAAAALAGWSWLRAARAGSPFVPRHALLLAAAGGLAAGGRVAGVIPDPSGTVVMDLLLLAAAVAALVGVSGIVRMVAFADTWPTVMAEAVLAASSIAALLWVLLGGTTSPGPTGLLSAAPALVDLTTTALVLRLPAAVPGMFSRAPWKVAAATGSALLLCAANAVHGVRAFGMESPTLLTTALAVAGYLVVAAIPLKITKVRRRLPQRPPAWLRLLPYGLVASAVLAVCVQALTAGTGPVPMVLVSVVVVSLIVLQALGLRENSALVHDLEASRHRLSALIENTSDLIVRLDANGRVLAANAAAVRLLHRTPTAVAGRSFDDLAQEQDRRRVREAVLAVARGRQETAEVELGLAPPAAGTAQLRLRALPGGAVANLNDVTEAVELRNRLERMARYDQMTGLLNRAHLLELIAAWLHERDVPVAVLYADLDGFKGVNDRFGHSAGDRVLIDVAARLDAIAKGLSPRRTIVGRVGGDEFVLGLEGVGPEDAWAAAQRLVEAVSPPFTLFGRTVQLGASVGVAGSGEGFGSEVDPGEGGAAELLHRADLAMYAAKAGGRARVGQWEPALEERARRRVDIAIGLRGALDTGRLGVGYQPIVRLSDGVVVGVEALLRVPPGVDAAGLPPGLDALVSPAELVAVAEDTGTIAEMGHWVLAQAVRQAAEWAADGHDISVNVNVSVQQLLVPEFTDTVAQVIEDAGLPASRLVLELTESQLADRPGPAVSAMERLHASGVRLAIDDFGTGYSSLSYLRHLPVQVVKLDRALLDGVDTDPRAESLARSVVEMARGLDLMVVAEGLEDLDAVRVMRELGADTGQGFALSPALPADRLTAVLDGPPLDLGAPAGPAIAPPDPRDGDLTSRDPAWVD